MVLIGTHAAAFANLDGHGAADHVTAGQILGRGGIALHKALAFGIGQITAFAACAFGDQTARAINAGGVELHKFHVLQRQARAQHHGIAIAGTGMGAGGAEIGAAITAGGQNHGLGHEPVQGAVIQLPGRNAPAAAIFHDQVEGEIFDKEFDILGQGLAIHGVQHGMTSAVGGGAGALHRAFAIIAGHATKGALIDLAIIGAREGHAPVLKLINSGWRITAQIFNRVLIAQPV